MNNLGYMLTKQGVKVYLTEMPFNPLLSAHIQTYGVDGADNDYGITWRMYFNTQSRESLVDWFNPLIWRLDGSDQEENDVNTYLGR